MKFERLAALGALAICGAVLAKFALLAWLAMPTAYGGAPGATGGMDGITRSVIWIAAFVPTAIFIGAHLAFAKQLRGGTASLND